MKQNMMLPVPPAEQQEKETGQGSETAFQQASATALQETEGASAF